MKVLCCPYWEHYDAKIHGPLPPEYDDPNYGDPGAYCSYLHTGDWLPDGTMLLWDQVKECGLNYGFEDEELDVQ